MPSIISATVGKVIEVLFISISLTPTVTLTTLPFLDIIAVLLLLSQPTSASNASATVLNGNIV